MDVFGWLVSGAVGVIERGKDAQRRATTKNEVFEVSNGGR